MNARRWTCVAAVLALLAAGCAAHAPAELPPGAAIAATPAPAAAAPESAPGPAVPAVRPSALSADSLPSPAARSVLQSIPEPLPASPGARVPVPHAPAPAPVAVPAPAHTASELSATASAPAAVAPPTDSTITAADTASVPVPAPTRPMGDSGGSATVMPPDSAGARGASAPPAASAPPPAATPPPAASAPRAASPDTCWRVQVGAPSERARGSVLRTASESLLLLPMVVVHESARWKVRTRDCLSRTAAEGVRDRAVASGFKGVFLVRFVERH